MQKAKRQRVVFSQDIKHLASKENSSIEGASPTPPTFDFCLFSQQLLWSVKKKQRAIRVPKERDRVYWPFEMYLISEAVHLICINRRGSS